MMAEGRSAAEVRNIQIQNLKKRGYQFNKKEIPLPDKEKLKLGFALLVDYKTDVDLQCKNLGVSNSLNGHFKNLHPKPEKRWGWIYNVDNGGLAIGLSAADANEKFKGLNRRGLTIVEGLALYRDKPQILRENCIMFTGTMICRDILRVADLYISCGKNVKLGSTLTDRGNGCWMSASTSL